MSWWYFVYHSSLNGNPSGKSCALVVISLVSYTALMMASEGLTLSNVWVRFSANRTLRGRVVDFLQGGLGSTPDSAGVVAHLLGRMWYFLTGVSP